MPVFKSGSNRVVVDEPLEGQEFVQVVWFGPPQDGLHAKVFEGPVEPIEDYEATIAWAIDLAKQMTSPLYVLPMTGAEVMRTEHMRRGVATLTDPQRGELRDRIVSMLASITRDSDDAEVRADAHTLLNQMKVVKA